MKNPHKRAAIIFPCSSSKWEKEKMGKGEEEVGLQNVLSTTMAKMQAASAINFIINKVCCACATVLNYKLKC